MMQMKSLKKYRRQICHIALVLGVCCSLSYASLEGARAVDLSKEASISVTLVDNQDVKEAGVVFDLYQVAEIEKMAHVDEIEMTVFGDFSSEEVAVKGIAQMDTEEIAELSQKLAGIALSKEAFKRIEATDTSSFTSLKSGVYLILAHGSDIESPLVERETEDGNKKLMGMAVTSSKNYYFMPQLVVLPGMDAEEYLFDLDVTMKSEFENRLGNLEIKKSLLTYVEGESSDFVFQIEAYNDESKAQKVYSDVIAISFEDAKEASYVLEELLPIGAYVEVTEVYSGSKYQLVSEATQTTIIPKDGAGITEFVNDYDEEKKSGGAVVNHFAYDEAEGWIWSQE